MTRKNTCWKQRSNHRQYDHDMILRARSMTGCGRYQGTSAPSRDGKAKVVACPVHHVAWPMHQMLRYEDGARCRLCWGPRCWGWRYDGSCCNGSCYTGHPRRHEAVRSVVIASLFFRTGRPGRPIWNERRSAPMPGRWEQQERRRNRTGRNDGSLYHLTGSRYNSSMR